MSEALKVKGVADLPLTPDPSVRLWKIRRVYQFANGEMVGLIGMCEGPEHSGAIEHCMEQASAYCFLRGEEFAPERMISKPFRCPAHVHRKIKRDWVNYQAEYNSPRGGGQ